jgi:hypothetical protein
MTAQIFYLTVLGCVALMSFASWFGYESWERKTALKWNAAAAVWFFFLFWAASSQAIETTLPQSSLLILSLLLAINARRLLLAAEALLVKHSAADDISEALRSMTPIDTELAFQLRGGSAASDFPVPGLRGRFHRRQAALARALRDRVQADTLLAEAIVRRERAREEAEVLLARNRWGPDATRELFHIRPGHLR